MKRNLMTRLMALGTALAAGASQAVIPVTDVTAAITDSLAPAIAVGVAVIVAYAGIFAFKLIKRVL